MSSGLSAVEAENKKKDARTEPCQCVPDGKQQRSHAGFRVQSRSKILILKSVLQSKQNNLKTREFWIRYKVRMRIHNANDGLVSTGTTH